MEKNRENLGTKKNQDDSFNLNVSKEEENFESEHETSDSNSTAPPNESSMNMSDSIISEDKDEDVSIEKLASLETSVINESKEAEPNDLSSNEEKNAEKEEHTNDIKNGSSNLPKSFYDIGKDFEEMKNEKEDNDTVTTDEEDIKQITENILKNSMFSMESFEKDCEMPSFNKNLEENKTEQVENLKESLGKYI